MTTLRMSSAKEGLSHLIIQSSVKLCYYTGIEILSEETGGQNRQTVLDNIFSLLFYWIKNVLFRSEYFVR